ncbi:unnamed protein product [Caenorhabditis sp. 36 PRJEB53466]|nr:unnamed protein product [Caenorhabditis sp. 36 PRJEB53466]
MNARSMILPALVVILLLVEKNHGSTITMERIKKAARKCCDVPRVNCCIDTIVHQIPIKCDYESDEVLERQIHNCLQGEIFEKEARVDLDDSVCCTVFGHDATDIGKRCEHKCKDLMKSPSVDAATRLDRIEHCKIVDNPLYQCFTKCRQLRRRGFKIEVLRFREYCNVTENITPHSSSFFTTPSPNAKNVRHRPR